jgi:hypothetical protein
MAHMAKLLDEIAKEPIKRLIYGPSGCGKSMMAQATCGEIRKENPYCAFVSIDSTKMLMGNAIDNVNLVFDAINDDKTINVVLIDDLELFIADLRTKPEALRQAISRIKHLQNIALIASTRHPWDLGKEVLELFDAHLPMLYPDREGRREILILYFSAFESIKDQSAIIDKIADSTEFFSGLELAQIVKEAFFKNPILEYAHFQSAIDKIGSEFTVENRRRELSQYVAFAEADPKNPREMQKYIQGIKSEFKLALIGNLTPQEFLESFENELRLFIEKRMLEVAGKNWWKARVPPDVQEHCEKNKAKKLPRKDSPFKSEIFFIEFNDYIKIITRKDNWQQVFRTYFIQEEWIRTKLNEISPIRNDIGHSRGKGLSAEDIKKLELYSNEIIDCFHTKK